MANEHDDDYHADDGDFRDRMQPGDRMISYNLPKAERPDGLKVRFKINVVSDQARAKEIDARQAEAIMDLLRWCREHREQQEQARQDQAAPAASPGPDQADRPADPRQE
jgi:hypothetical protein